MKRGQTCGRASRRPGSPNPDSRRRSQPADRVLPGFAPDSQSAALVFHCLTSHAALPNCDTVLRLSGDFRWQCSDQPAPAQLVLGPAGGERELFSRLFARHWWEPVPAGLTLVPRERLAASPPGPSHYFPVHYGWRCGARRPGPSTR
jgi:hypothetical protein